MVSAACWGQRRPTPFGYGLARAAPPEKKGGGSFEPPLYHNLKTPQPCFVGPKGVQCVQKRMRLEMKISYVMCKPLYVNPLRSLCYLLLNLHLLANPRQLLAGGHVKDSLCADATFQQDLGARLIGYQPNPAGGCAAGT